MKTSTILGVLLVAFVVLSVAVNLPDIMRYIRLRSM